MAKLENFAPEVLAHIIKHFALGRIPTSPWCKPSDEYQERKNTLRQLTLVSKRIGNVAERFLYLNVTIHNGKQAVLLLRTLWLKPHLRNYPQNIAILLPVNSREFAAGMVSLWNEFSGSLPSRAIYSEKLVKDDDGFPKFNLALLGDQRGRIEEKLNDTQLFDQGRINWDYDRLSPSLKATYRSFFDYSEPRPLRFVSAVFALINNAQDMLLRTLGDGCPDPGYQLAVKISIFDPSLSPIITPPRALRLFGGKTDVYPFLTELDPWYLRFTDIGKGTNLGSPSKGTVTRFECHSDTGVWGGLLGDLGESEEGQVELPILGGAELDALSVLQDLRLYDSQTVTSYIYRFLMRCANLKTLHWVISNSMPASRKEYPIGESMGLQAALDRGSSRLRRLYIEPRGTTGQHPKHARPITFAHFNVLEYLAIDVHVLMGYCHMLWVKFIFTDAPEGDDEAWQQSQEEQEEEGEEEEEEVDEELEREPPSLASVLPRSIVEFVSIDRAAFLCPDDYAHSKFGACTASQYWMTEKLAEFLAGCATTHPHLRRITLKTYKTRDFRGDGFEELIDGFAKAGVALSWERLRDEKGAEVIFEDDWTLYPVLNIDRNDEDEVYTDEEEYDDDEEYDEDDEDWKMLRSLQPR